jgi:hypothetical protein
MQFSSAITTTGDKGLPRSIADVPGALRALQLMGASARTPHWRDAWESLWTASESGDREDVDRAAAALKEMLRRHKCLAAAA